MQRPYLLILIPAICAFGQEPLTLRDAVNTALRQNKAMAALEAGAKMADARLTQARSGRLPHIGYNESYARSNNPVFVFSSLLTQHRFGAQNFQIDTLNRPDSLNNFQSQVSGEQSIYDGGQTRSLMRAAQLGREMTKEERRRAEMELTAYTIRAYYGVLLGGESLNTAKAAVKSAEADLRRAESVREAGMSTEADVLSIRVHLAAVREQEIRAASDLDVARATLNDAMGLPLDTPHTLASRLEPGVAPVRALKELEGSATAARPELRQFLLATKMAAEQGLQARAMRLPQIGFKAMFEADRQRFVVWGGTNWMAGLSMKWNLFDGYAAKSQMAEARHAGERATAQMERAASAVKLDVRRAWAGVESAQQRIEVSKAAMAEAAESLRITKNRYEGGMGNVTDLLRNETAVLESRTRYLAAVHDQRIALAMLQLAAGSLTVDSEVLN